MQEQIILNFRTEMEANKSSSYIQVVGQFLISHLEKNPSEAEHFSLEGKTISKSLEAMRKIAEEKRQGNCAVLTDSEGFSIVLDYFREKPNVAKTTIPSVSFFDAKEFTQTSLF
ncbi:hypothetical protein [Alicyclobacillus fodiniaquatilis]|uniref:Uncharacterized protein n=1 Tax=Alicyclobacillus fodiniaquatilis TaxID=1661150 RepID=A0ABW4JCP6_9BACL